MFFPRQYLKFMCEAYRKEAEMFLLPCRKAERELLSLSLVPLGYIFGLFFFSPSISIHALFLVGVKTPKFCHSLLPPFSFGCFIPNRSSILHYTPYFRIRKTKHFSRGPSCVLSLSGPDPSQVCSGCVCSEVAEASLSSRFPWRLGLQVRPGCIQLTYSFNLGKN